MGLGQPQYLIPNTSYSVAALGSHACILAALLFVGVAELVDALG